MQLRFRFYASLLDAFQQYLDSDIIWEKYWGYSETPPHTPEEFRKQQFQSLIDRINRVHYDNEAVDRGTAFNEVIDCMVENRGTDKVKVEKLLNNGIVAALNATYNNRTFCFPMPLVREVSDYYKGALTQQYVQAVLHTMFGDVLVYGFIDYVLPFLICDLKTTGRYSVGDFKNHWQHIVYPYAMMENGSKVFDFEYNVVEFGKSDYNTYTESYSFVPERDVPKLTQHCEDFIRFLQQNRELITDKKIFNLAA